MVRIPDLEGNAERPIRYEGTSTQGSRSDESADRVPKFDTGVLRRKFGQAGRWWRACPYLDDDDKQRASAKSGGGGAKSQLSPTHRSTSISEEMSVAYPSTPRTLRGNDANDESHSIPETIAVGKSAPSKGNVEKERGRAIQVRYAGDEAPDEGIGHSKIGN